MKNIKYISFLVVTAGILSACSNSNPFLQEDFLTNGENTTLNEFFTEGTKKTEVKVISGMVQGSDEEGLTIDEAFGTNGELLLPFDQAFPYYMQNTKYDANSVLVKCDNYDIFSVYRALSLNGVTGYEEIVKVDNDTSWYKLFLKDISSKKAINLFRSLNTKAQIFDLNYILDNSSLTENVDSSTLNTIQKSGETTIDNCGIDNANKNKYFKEQWYFKEIGLRETYKTLKNEGAPEGGEGTVVAVIDTGVDINHEDLRKNIWTNALEIPNNNIDDDNNGYIDDVNGWNFVDNNNNPDDDQGHGTHVAGIIGAENNDVGVVGIAYKTKIMPLKAGDGAGYFTQDRIAEAIIYAYMNGADIINMSFGGSSCSLAVQDALESAYTTSVLVAAAGNDKLVNTGVPIFPAAFSHVVGVMSINSRNVESEFTNFDGEKQDLYEYEVYAPGENIYSTIPNNRYTSLSGTSMAAPIVTGIIALLKTNFNDSNQYPTKFFMGQVVASNDKSPSCSHFAPHNIPKIVNAYTSLTAYPKPSVNMLQYYLFDNKEISSKNNGDGNLDAGETVYLAPVLFNSWGKAKNATIEFDTKSSISGEESKYLTIDNCSINFGDVGTYSTKDFLIYNDNSSQPISADFSKCLRIDVSEDASNNIFVPFNCKIFYLNALNEDDTSIYESDKLTVNLQINRGEIVPKIIKEDTTLTSDKLWIVNDQVQVGEDTTLTIEPGTEMVFGDSETNSLFGGQQNSPSIRVFGTLVAKGTSNNLISITHNNIEFNDSITITGDNIFFEYCTVKGNMNIDSKYVNHCYFEVFLSVYTILENGVQSGNLLTSFKSKCINSSKIVYTNIDGVWDFNLTIQLKEINNSVLIFENNFETSVNCTIVVDAFKNTTFLTRGQGKISLKFVFWAANVPIHGSYYSWNETSTSKINQIYFEDHEGKYNLRTIFSFFIETAALLKEQGISLYCPIDKHYTDECCCSFPHNSMIPGLCDGQYVYLLDGSKISLEELETLFTEVPREYYNATDVNPLITYVAYSGSSDGVRYLTNSESNTCSLLTGTKTIFEKEGNLAIGAYTVNAFDEKEFKYAKQALAIFTKNAGIHGIGDAGNLQAENINIISSNLTSEIRVDSGENRIFDEYTYENAFNFNTSNEEIIDYIVNDGNDGFYRPYIGIADENHEGNSSLWPYVVKLETRNARGDLCNTFGNEEINVTIHLNREMDVNVPIDVRFGSTGIYSDYKIEGEFIDSKTWVGTYTLNTLIESGNQYFNIGGGAALTDSFMDIEEAPGRFSFVIDTTQSLSKTISGISNEDGILLSWMQDDFGLDTIMGYNIYRSNEENGNYTKINKSIISKGENEFLDANVMPGETYWYTFTVVLSDFTESSPAGKISVTAMDTMSPNIYHNPVYEAYTGSKLTISCLISDNIGVENAYLYYRKAGETSYKRILMNSSNNRFTASISASDLSLEGIEYYIEASDGTNIVSKGTADDPYYVMIRDSALLDAIGDVDGDGEITVKDAYLILQHIYGEILLTGDSFTRADLNKDGKLSTSEAYRILQYINGNITSLTY